MGIAGFGRMGRSTMNQGEIWLINLDPTIHSEIGKTRPAVIISVNAMNLHSPRLIIAPITSIAGKIYPFEVFISAGTGGIDKDSKIMPDQMRSIDKRRLVRKIGKIDNETLIKACNIARELIESK
jgi:mRNA interferase MazF